MSHDQLLPVFITEISPLLLSNSEGHMINCYWCLSLKISVVNTDNGEIPVINTPVAILLNIFKCFRQCKIITCSPVGDMRCLTPSGPVHLQVLNTSHLLQVLNMSIP